MSESQRMELAARVVELEDEAAELRGQAGQAEQNVREMARYQCSAVVLSAVSRP